MLLIVKLFFIYLFLYSWGTFASSYFGGNISFSGMIIEDPCEFIVKENKLISKCYIDGKIVKNSHQLDNMKQQKTINVFHGKLNRIKVEWLNKERTLGTVIINYL